jgi:integrase/recombinase XerD
MQHTATDDQAFDTVRISVSTSFDAGVPLRDVQIAARHADPRTTTIYDRRRENFDRHAAYVVVAFVAGG